MARIPEDYMNKVYAGWLGKIIGIRHGAPVEGWSYERLAKIYGEIDGYLVEYDNFAADDDSNGPVFLLRALEDYTYTNDLTAEEVGLTLLNYAPYEHGFFWWGGYGKSTEHTAYLNLRNGIMAPRSGSVEQNGAAVAEQIGGQIFSDVWGLVVPNDPGLAAEYAQKASSVTHGGNGIYGGMFIAACISAAFTETDMGRIIESGLSVIPYNSEYARMSRDVILFHKAHPLDWRECFKFVKDNYGYDRYPGVCHIIPNSAVIVLSLLYGNGSFSKSINICNMCGWDTDCNVANVGTILGVRNGLEGIDYKVWRKPINDFFVCSSVIGSLNILNIPYVAEYTARLAYQIASETPPERWGDILNKANPRFHFEFPGSTHGFRTALGRKGNFQPEVIQTTDFAHSGKGSLKIKIPNALIQGDVLRTFVKTYYRPSDFHDSRYDPSFSPILYPGQSIKGYLLIPDTPIEQGGALPNVAACLYVKDGNSRKEIESRYIDVKLGNWNELCLNIPFLDGACLEEAGIKLYFKSACNKGFIAYLDDFEFYGQPDYNIDFSKERMEVWNLMHKEVSQFTYVKGIWTIEEGELSGSCCDFGEAYTGGIYWKDYIFDATILPKLGEHHNINFRVQGAIRSYAVGLAPGNKLVLYKNENGYKVLTETVYHWENGGEYSFRIIASGSNFKVISDDKTLIEYTDTHKPYLHGQIGVSVQKGSHCHYKDFKISRA